MANIPEPTEDEKRTMAIKLLRSVADMIENADYVHIDESIFEVYRGYMAIFTDPSKIEERKPDKESSFSLAVSGEIG